MHLPRCPLFSFLPVRTHSLRIALSSAETMAAHSQRPNELPVRAGTARPKLSSEASSRARDPHLHRSTCIATCEPGLCCLSVFRKSIAREKVSRSVKKRSLCMTQPTIAREQAE